MNTKAAADDAKYTDELEKENAKRVKDAANTAKNWASAITQISSALSGVIGENLAGVISQVANVGNSIANVFETGGTSITAWAGLAASLITGVITLFSGSDRAARISAELAEKAKKSAEEASSALSQVLKSGTSSYETFLGLQQASEYLVKVQDASNKAAQSLSTYQRMYSQYYDQYYWDIMRASKGTANVAETQARAAKSAEAMASSYKMEADSARKYAETLEYVNATVYTGNVVTADTSDILAEWADKLDDVVQTYGETSTQVAAMNEYYQKLIYDALYPVAAALEENNANLQKNANLWKLAANSVTAFETQLSNLREAASGIYASFGNIGADIASSLVDGLTSGLDVSDFMASMKEYITKIVIQTAVYTDEMTSKLADIGSQIANAVSSGLTGASLENSMKKIKDQLKEVYATAEQAAQKTSSVLTAVFGTGEKAADIQKARDEALAKAKEEGKTSDDLAEINKIYDARLAASVGYASGTLSASAGYHMVGESGPELMYVPGGSRVYNNNETNNIVKGGTGARNISYTFNSPKAMNQYEMARAVRQQSKQLAFKGAF